MVRCRHLVPCDATGLPADVGTPLSSTKGTAWAGLPFSLYRLHEAAVVREAFQNGTVVALCLSGNAEMGVRVGAKSDRSVSSEGAIAICGDGLEYKSLDWSGTTDIMMVDLDATSLLEEAGAISSQAAPLHRFLIRDQNISTLMLAMEAEMRTGCTSGAIYAQSLSTALAAYLASHYAGHIPAFRQGAKLSPAQSGRVRDYVEAHLSDDISLKDLAAVAQLSPSHFSELFKRTFECAPHRYVIHRRIAAAGRLLAENRLPISEITQMTGFSDQSHFTTVFRKISGTTPKQYQLRSRNA
jgi:AraC family transcriptional regulator